MGYNVVFLCGDPSFYHKLGFTVTYHYGIYYVKDKTADWFMVKERDEGFLNQISGMVVL